MFGHHDWDVCKAPTDSLPEPPLRHKCNTSKRATSRASQPQTTTARPPLCRPVCSAAHRRSASRCPCTEPGPQFFIRRSPVPSSLFPLRLRSHRRRESHPLAATRRPPQSRHLSAASSEAAAPGSHSQSSWSLIASSPFPMDGGGASPEAEYAGEVGL